MVNNSDFSKRLKKVLEYYNLSASQFAEKIKVQRSSISHLLSGRNKPSLDFVLRVLETFEEIELYWLLNGKGTFPKESKKLDFPTTLFSNENIKSNETTNLITKDVTEEVPEIDSSSNSEIDRIVIFYKNGTFKHYKEI